MILNMTLYLLHTRFL